jgi:hypothetical protein
MGPVVIGPWPQHVRLTSTDSASDQRGERRLGSMAGPESRVPEIK